MPTLLEWPVEWDKFVSTQFSLQSVVLGTRSAATPRRTNQLSYQVFRVQGNYKTELGPSIWQGKSAWFARLDGEAGLFRMHDSLRCQPMFNRLNRALVGNNWSDGTKWSDGTAWESDLLVPENCAVDATVAQGSTQVTIRGLPVSTAAILNPGDLFEIQPGGFESETMSNLYEVVRGGDSDSSGKLNIEFRPRARVQFTINDPAVFRYARGLFQLADPDQGRIFREGNRGSFGFSAVEYVD